MTRVIALIALVALGLSQASFHEPFHAQGPPSVNPATVRNISDRAGLRMRAASSSTALEFPAPTTAVLRSRRFLQHRCTPPGHSSGLGYFGHGAADLRRARIGPVTAASPGPDRWTGAVTDHTVVGDRVALAAGFRAAGPDPGHGGRSRGRARGHRGAGCGQADGAAPPAARRRAHLRERAGDTEMAAADYLAAAPRDQHARALLSDRSGRTSVA